MFSKIDICNMALAHLGDRRISRLDEDAQVNDPLVRYCSEFYEQTKMEVLAAQRWTFAKKAVGLTRVAEAVTIGFTYSHTLPTDMLRLMSLHEASTVEGVTTYSTRIVEHFKIVGNQVWSDTQDMAVLYIGNMDNPDEWTPHFRSCVARLLAHYLAGPVADNPGESQKHLDIYERVALPNAQFYDAVQDNSNENTDLRTRRARSPLIGVHRDTTSSGESRYGSY